MLIGKNTNFSPFRPGMSASVEIMTKNVSNVITVPVQAVTTRIDTIKIKEQEMKAQKKTASQDKENADQNTKQKANENTGVRFFV